MRAERLCRLAHRGQRHRRGGGEVDVVVADDRDVVRHGDAQMHQLLQQAERERSLAQKTAVGRCGAGRPGEPLSGLASGRDRQRVGDQHDEVAGGAAGRGDRAQRAVVAVGDLRDRRWTADERDPFVALLDAGGYGELAAAYVVDADAAPVGAPVARRSTSTTGTPSAGRLRSSGASSFGGGDEHAVHALLQQQVEIFGLARRPRRCCCT